MGFFDALTNLFDPFATDVSGAGNTGFIGSILGGLDTGTQPFPVMNYPVAARGYPDEIPNPGMPSMGQVPMIMGGVARWAMRFPNLWQALQRITANYGVKMSVDKLWGMVKSMGPQVIVGLIGAAALQELFVYHSTHKRRRMNVANTKALRRSVRRLKGFDRLSHRVSSQLARVGGRRHRSASRRCATCRHSPCTC